MLVRTTPLGSQGFQILLDHRRSGGIGGFYGNGLGAFHALTHTVDAAYDSAGNPIGLVAEDPETSLEPVTPDKQRLLSYGAAAETFLAAWRWDDWNRFRIRCEGKYPLLTVWINDVMISQIDTAPLKYPGYDRDAAADLLGHAGHIALEVHDNDTTMGAARWGVGAACRWRNIQLREL